MVKRLIPKKWPWLVLGTLIIFGAGFGSARASEDPHEIVRRADKIRAPSGSYWFNAQIQNYEDGKLKGTHGYKVYVKDLDRSVVEFLSPPSEKGKSLLMLSDDVWIFLPRVRKPVRVPLKQRLLGEVAIGDMTRANFSHDYDARLVGEEKWENKNTFVLELRAKSEKKPYPRIQYWVEQKTYRPLKAEYFAASGKSLKTAVWKNFKQQSGVLRPLLIEYLDSIKKSKKSLLEFQNFTSKELDDRMFTKQYLRTFE